MKKTTGGILSALFLLLLFCSCAKSHEKGRIDSGSTDARTETDPTLFSGTKLRLDNRVIDNVDLLFVVDDSKSMMQEQAKLRDQFPRMIGVLTTGDKTPDNGIYDGDLPPVKSLHLAVVSSNMGLPGLEPEDNPVTTGACNGTGDDGRFLNDPSHAIEAGINCPGSTSIGYGSFLVSTHDDSENPLETSSAIEYTAAAFGCMATLGLDGCGFEMQLDAPLKALWPSQIGNLSEFQQSLGITFVGGSQGRGDDEHREFLRGTTYHPTEAGQLSVLAIIVVTDEEDCSAGANGDLEFLSLNFSVGDRQDLSLRCYKDTIDNWGNKYPVDRYIDGFKALRPDRPDLVVFGAITGIPASVEEDANGDDEITAEESDGYFNRILNHEMMQESPNPETNNLNYSCEHQDRSGEYDTRAYPARRITEVARGFGANGVVRSICADTFEPAMDAIIDRIANNLGEACLSEALARGSDGRVDCQVIWHMPEGRGCDQSYLHEPDSNRPQTDEAGRTLCVVDQISVINADTNDPAEALDSGALGWYYDDFSSDMDNRCRLRGGITTKQRISYALHQGSVGEQGNPPEGARVDLECLQQGF